MKRWLCGAGIVGMLLTGPVAAQYIATWQDPAGVWKGPAESQPGTDLELAAGAAHRACLDRGNPKLWNRAAKVTEKATGKVFVELDCNAERTKTKKGQPGAVPSSSATTYQVSRQDTFGRWTHGFGSDPGGNLALAEGYAYETCKDRGNPKDQNLASKVTEKGTGKVVLEVDCKAERAKMK